MTCRLRFAELKVGDTVEGMVTGVIDFGAFVNVDGIEGLIHISRDFLGARRQSAQLRQSRRDSQGQDYRHRQGSPEP